MPLKNSGLGRGLIELAKLPEPPGALLDAPRVSASIRVASTAKPSRRLGPPPCSDAPPSRTTKPAVGQVQVHLLAKAPARSGAQAVADNQHPNHQLRQRTAARSSCRTRRGAGAAQIGRRTGRRREADDRQARESSK